MSETRKLLIDKIVSPVAYSHMGTLTEGIVLESNEKFNLCTIKFKNKYGETIIIENVPVQLQNISIIDWFPEQNDKVLVSLYDEEVLIVGPAIPNQNEIQQELLLKQDLLTDSFIDCMGGFIF